MHPPSHLCKVLVSVNYRFIISPHTSILHTVISHLIQPCSSTSSSLPLLPTPACTHALWDSPLHSADERRVLAGFYSGPVAAAIAEAVCSRQGVLAEADLAAHRTAMVAPISTEYKGHRVYEVPPPTQVRTSRS